MLREIGAWLAVNGEGIYATRPWTTHGEGPTQVASGAFTDTKRTTFTSQDIRFTRQGDTIYAHVLAWPGHGSVAIRSLGSNSPHRLAQIIQIEMLGSDQPLQWQIDGDSLRIDVSGCALTGGPFVLKISG